VPLTAPQVVNASDGIRVGINFNSFESLNYSPMPLN
jgi:hypothetical protein